jgi:hypothetical protein
VIRFLADENFREIIVRGVRRRFPEIDLVHVHELGLDGTPDPELLEWAALNGRVLLTHDVQTMTHFAYERVRAGLPMPGVFEVGYRISNAIAIEEILILAQCSSEGEWEGQVRYFPI